MSFYPDCICLLIADRRGCATFGCVALRLVRSLRARLCNPPVLLLLPRLCPARIVL